MPKFYMTFGVGQPNEGRVLPIIADNEAQARAYMYDKYNGHWCGTYTQEYWSEWLERAKRQYFLYEEEMTTIDIREVPNATETEADQA